MLILLPPSEGKAEITAGRPLDLGALSLPELRPARERVLDALIALCATGAESASPVLGLTAGQRDAVRRNAELRRAATRPAGEIYTGVLFDTLGLASISRPGYRWLQRSVLIFSGLWGAVRLGDRIPTYRCSIGVNLPGPGGLTGFWRAALPAVLTEAAGTGLVLDLRSAAYAATWTPGGELAGRTVAVRVLQERTVHGVTQRSVVSHFNKATKGRLVRDLADAGARPRSPAQLVTALRDLKYTVHEAPAPVGAPRRLDVVVTEL